MLQSSSRRRFTVPTRPILHVATSVFTRCVGGGEEAGQAAEAADAAENKTRSATERTKKKSLAGRKLSQDAPCLILLPADEHQTQLICSARSFHRSGRLFPLGRCVGSVTNSHRVPSLPLSESINDTTGPQKSTFFTRNSIQISNFNNKKNWIHKFRAKFAYSNFALPTAINSFVPLLVLIAAPSFISKKKPSPRGEKRKFIPSQLPVLITSRTQPPRISISNSENDARKTHLHHFFGQTQV